MADGLEASAGLRPGDAAQAFDVMAHLGDQIYADQFEKMLKANPDRVYTQKELLAKFRVLYRMTFGRPAMQRMMRTGSHLFLPDDHEIVNNVARHHKRDPRMQAVVGAGRIAFLEFQAQLRTDLPAGYDHEAMHDDFRALEKAYFYARWGSTALLMGDLRYEKLFHYDDVHPLVGSRQFEEHKRTLAGWAADPAVDSIVALFNVPLVLDDPIACDIVELFEADEYPAHRAHATAHEHGHDQEALLDVLFSTAYGYDKLKLLAGGDVHMHASVRVCERDARVPVWLSFVQSWVEYVVGEPATRKCVPQIISSGISEMSSSVNSAHIYLYHWIVTNLLPSACGGTASYGWTFDPDVSWTERLSFQNNYGVIELGSEGVMRHYGVFRPISELTKGRAVLEFLAKYVNPFLFHAGSLYLFYAVLRASHRYQKTLLFVVRACGSLCCAGKRKSD
jgi:hypothetical protein